jgi:predicted AlkP superfamily phosphohydrolase/phosphomutase/cytochrome c-type biogenesis protein CcmH/NrfG
MTSPLARKVLLIGWDAADWKLITPLLDRGQMPNLARLVERGVMGNLSSIEPKLSPMLWTSIATGKRPWKHGISGFVEPAPDGRGIRPVSSTSRRTKALWNILSQNNLRSNVISWYAGHPAEPIRGACVTQAFQKETTAQLPPGTFYPPGLAAHLGALRVHPSEIDGHSLLSFVPQAAEVDQSKDGRLAILAERLAECLTVHAAATWLIENEPWDFMAVYYDAIDHLSHTFMHYHPPRMQGVPEKDFELYKNVVAETYRFQDLLLGPLLALAGEETTVIVCSDHGYHSDHLRPPWTPAVPGGPEVWHRNFGIVLMAGPHIKKDERIYGATLLDIAPTVLRLFGLPVGADMDGRVWTEAFETPVDVQRVPSWDSISGDSGMHAPETRLESWEASAALRQLAALGYIEQPSTEAQTAIEIAERSAKFYMAWSLIDGRMPSKAIPLLEELYAQDPAHLMVALNLATCYQQTGRRAEARRLAEELISRSKDPAQPAFGRPAEPPEIRASRTDGTQGPRIIPQANLLLGMIALDDNQIDAALDYLQRAEREHSTIHVYVHIGRAYLRLRRWQDAERTFENALALDPDNPHAHDGLAAAYLGLRRNEEAAEQALAAVGLQHAFPAGHFHLGVALVRLGMIDRAIQAFKHCVSFQAERANQAHRWLSHLQRIAARTAVGAIT